MANRSPPAIRAISTSSEVACGGAIRDRGGGDAAVVCTDRSVSLDFTTMVPSNSWSSRGRDLWCYHYGRPLLRDVTSITKMRFPIYRRSAQVAAPA
jgi:hypothetical protein